MILAFLALYGWPAGSETWRTAAFAPILGLAAAMPLLVIRAPWARAVTVLGLAVALPVLLLPYTRPEQWVIQLLPGALVVVLVGPMEVLVARRRGPSMAIGLAIAAGAATGLVLVSEFLKLSIPLAALSFSTALLAVYTLRRPTLSLAAGPLLVIVPTTATALVFAWLEEKYRQGPIPVAAFALAALAPLAMWLAELAPLLRRRARLGGVVRVALVAGACAGAFALALVRPKPASPSGDYDRMYHDMLGK